MKKLVLFLAIIIIGIYNSAYAKSYVYEVNGEPVCLFINEEACLGDAFLTETDYGGLPSGRSDWVDIKFLGIDSNNNIHLMRTLVQKKYKKSEDHLILKFEPQNQISIKMLFTIMKISVMRINNSVIKIKLLPNEYIKEP